MNRRVTIRDIAQELGLSTATVSNVIHGKTARVSSETARRVQELLEKYEYIPSMAGLLLAQNDSKIIGIFVNDHEKYGGHTLDDPFIAESLNALSRQIEARGQFMMVKQAKSPGEVLRFASMWNMDALVMIGFCAQDYQYLRQHMRVPFVVYDGRCEDPSGFAVISIDDFGGGAQVGQYLRALGHTRAICIADNTIGVDAARMRGFQSTFGKQGTKIMLVPMQKPARLSFYARELSKLCQATAIFAVSDAYAIELLHVLGKSGIDVPGEISVVGFDDIPMCQMIFPALTTVRQSPAARAEQAMELLAALKAGRAAQLSITLSVQLVARESTAAPRKPL